MQKLTPALLGLTLTACAAKEPPSSAVKPADLDFSPDQEIQAFQERIKSFRLTKLEKEDRWQGTFVQTDCEPGSCEELHFSVDYRSCDLELHHQGEEEGSIPLATLGYQKSFQEYYQPYWLGSFSADPAWHVTCRSIKNDEGFISCDWHHQESENRRILYRTERFEDSIEATCEQALLAIDEATAN